MVDNLIFYSIIISLISIALVLVRFLIGPSILDRVVAFDTASIIAIAVIALLAHIFQRFIYLDISLVYGLLSFLGVLVVARYHEKGL